jgi:hypothetical protein
VREKVMGDRESVSPQGPIEGGFPQHGRDPYRDIPGWYMAAKVCLDGEFLINVVGEVPWVPWVVADWWLWGRYIEWGLFGTFLVGYFGSGWGGRDVRCQHLMRWARLDTNLFFDVKGVCGLWRR